MRILYDAVTPGNLPLGGDLYAGYVDGAGSKNIDAVRARFPDKKVVTITVIGGTTDADVVDVEKFDVIPEHAPAWVLQQRARGKIPTVYCTTSAWPAVRAAFDQQGVAEPNYWVANYSSGSAIPPGAIAHQWGGNSDGGYDFSTVADYWPGIDPPPAPPVTPPQPPKEYPDVNLIRIPVRIEQLDDQGNGYVDLPGDATKLVSIVINGMAYELDPGTLPHTYDRVADEVDCYQVGPMVRFKVTGALAHGAVQLYVWAVA